MTATKPPITAGEALWIIKAKRNRIKRPGKYESIQQWARDEHEDKARQILADAMAIAAVMKGEEP